MLGRALMQFVRSQGWRTADYVKEPGYASHLPSICTANAISRGPVNGLIDQYATGMETLAYVVLATCCAYA